MARLQKIVSWIVAADRTLHRSVASRFPMALSTTERVLAFLVDKVLSNPLFALIFSLVLIVMGYAGVGIIILVSLGGAWFVAFLWVARSSKTLRKLSIGSRLVALLGIGAILALGVSKLGNWALLQYQQTQLSPQKIPTASEIANELSKQNPPSKPMEPPPSISQVAAPLAQLEFSFFTELPKEIPIREISLPLKDGKVTIEFILANKSKTDAINGWFVLRVCEGCRFGNAPEFISVGGSSESQQEDRTHPIVQIFQGTSTPKMTAEVFPKRAPPSRFEVDFFYRCRTCDNSSEKQVMFVNVLPSIN